MGNTYPITAEQKAFLSTFTCQRLADDPTNLHKIQKFYSARGQGLVNSLRNFAWEEDTSASTAYYVIKTPRGRSSCSSP